MRRNLWFWLYFVLAILLAVYFATRIIMTFIGYGPIATVKNVSIWADANDKDLTAVAASVGISPGTHTHSVNLDLVNERIAKTPGVRHSAIRRMPNGNMSVKIQLYRAIATLAEDSYYYPLSADGKKTGYGSEERSPGAVVFRGPLPNDIGEITNAATNLVNDLDYIEWVDGRRWNLVTTDGMVVMLPEENPVAAIATLVTLNQKHNIFAKDIHIMDMRDSARILVK
ncbi:MAG: cell division protein FtsQ/DivIB [Alphaproteobacteria bacterium]|nr:cell division protein FtsQ/DivIB [Alphaproteobacteria bacterium]